MNLQQCRLLVTPTSYGRGGSDLRGRLLRTCASVVFNDTGKPLGAQELKRLLPGVDGYIAGLDEVNADVISVSDRLKVISRYGVGVDNVDLRAAQKRGIVVTNTPGANTVSVAELAIGLMLSLLRKIPEAVASTRAGGWPRMSGATLRGKCAGIVGFGAVGQCVAARLRAFECSLLAFDPYADPRKVEEAGVALSSLEELLAQSDVVTLHAPVTEETRRIASSSFFERMKPGSFLVNTARGELVDEEALVRAIESGRLAGAALDVFDREPIPADSPLLQSDRIIVTPHTAAHTDDAVNAMGEMATADCLAVLRGEEPRYPVR